MCKKQMMSVVLVFFVAASLLSCNPKPTPVANSASEQVATPAPSVEDEVKIGDVEQGVRMKLTLASNLTGPGIHQRLLEDQRSVTNLAQVLVTEPFPKELPLLVTISMTRTFPQTPVVLRLQALVDERIVATYAVIVGQEEKAKKDVLWTFDALKDMPTIPDTSLVVVRAETLLMPAGTDPTTLDPNIATASEDRVSTLLSNPMRITFGKAAAAASSTSDDAQ